MICIYCGSTTSTHRERNTDPQGEPTSGWHYECDDSAACHRALEERSKNAKARGIARRALLAAIAPQFAETERLDASQDAETFGNPKLREKQLVANVQQNHFFIDPPAESRAIWYVDFSGDWGKRRVLRAEWSADLDAQIRAWAVT